MKSRTLDQTAPMAAATAVDLKRDPPAGLACGGAARPAPADDAADVSVGLELKFLLLHPPPGPPPSSARDRHGPAADAEALQQQQRLAYDAVARTINRTGSQKAVSIHDIEAAGRQEREYWPSHWIVKKANSVEPSTPEDLRLPRGSLVPVELTSPRLRWRDLASAPPSSRKDKDRAESPIHVVLAALKRAHQTRVNYTCDVHVHIGRIDGQPLSLRTLKRLATLLWLAEPTLRSIRNPHSPNFTNTYTWGAELRRHSRLATAMSRSTPPADREEALRCLSSTAPSCADTAEAAELAAYLPAPAADAVRTVWRAASFTELGRLLSGPDRQFRRLGFNFSAFGGEDERALVSPRTVEFRVLEGTLRDALIGGWVHICCALVELAGGGGESFVNPDPAAPRPRFRDVVRRLGDAEHMLVPVATPAPVAAQQGGGQSKPPYPPPPLLEPRDAASAFSELLGWAGVDAAISAPFQTKIRQDRELGAAAEAAAGSGGGSD